MAPLTIPDETIGNTAIKLPSPTPFPGQKAISVAPMKAPSVGDLTASLGAKGMNPLDPQAAMNSAFNIAGIVAPQGNGTGNLGGALPQGVDLMGLKAQLHDNVVRQSSLAVGVDPDAGTSGSLTQQFDDQLAAKGFKPLPIATNGPIPAEKFDWEGEMNSGLDSMFAATGDDTLRGKMAKIKGRGEAERAVRGFVATLGHPPTPTEVRSMMRAYYEQTMGGPQPLVAGISKAASDALDRAFGMVPQRKVASVENLSKEEVGVLLAQGIAGLVRGKGFGSTLANLHQAVQNKQPVLDAQFEHDNAVAQAQQKAELEKYSRITALEDEKTKRDQALEDFDLGQAGYEARDERSAQRQYDLQVATLDRQLAVDDKRQAHATLISLVSMIPYLDSSRVAGLGALYEKVLGVPLPKEFYELSPTAGEDQKRKQTEAIDTDMEYRKALTDSIGLKDEQSRKLFSTQLERQQVGVQIDRQRLKKLKVETDMYPERIKSEIALNRIKVMTALSSAQAALVRAQKAGNPNAKSGTGAAWKELNTATILLDRDYSNIQAKYGSLRSEIEDLEPQIASEEQKIKLEAKSKVKQFSNPAKLADLKQRLETKNRELGRVKIQMDSRGKDIQEATERAKTMLGIAGGNTSGAYSVAPEPTPPKGSAK